MIASSDQKGKSLAANGKLLGDLAGVAFLQSPESQALLLPKARVGRVLVELRQSYAE